MGASYAALWRYGTGPVCAGQLVMTPTGLYLDGADRAGTTRETKAGVEEIRSIRIGRTSAERIDGRSSLIVELAGGESLVISSASGLGLTREIAEQVIRLANATAGG